MVDIVGRILESLEARQPVVLATIVGLGLSRRADSNPAIGRSSRLRQGGETPDHYLLGRKLLLLSDGAAHGGFGAPTFDSRVVADCQRALATTSSPRPISYVLIDAECQELKLEPETEIEIFVEVMLPPDTLLIVGAGHIAQPLSRIGKMLGFEVVVIDDRWSFANRDRFPEADRVIAGYYSQELAQFPITPSTYLVLVTRGHTHDEEALRQVIVSNAAYIGMIGSRRRVSAVLRHMVEEGIPQDKVDRVCSPIGLDIGAETPEEIAVSILAEVINLRRRGSHHPSSMSHKAQQAKRPN